MDQGRRQTPANWKPYLEDRLKAGVWNARVLLRELRQRKRESAQVVAVRRFETAPGKQAQVDWGHLGSLTENGKCYPLWGFTMALGTAEG